VIGLRAAGRDQARDAPDALRRELELELSDLVAAEREAGLVVTLYVQR
jgi:hypothetical protein